MTKEALSLGIDTSNYKTSVALTDSSGHILLDLRSFLRVKKGERGLRQSAAFFQHVQKLPDFIAQALADDEIRRRIGCIAVSDRPRPKEGSYMPVFTAGRAFAETLSAALKVPLLCFSHQEGHVEAVRYFAQVDEKLPYICFHFSGGTSEALLIDRKHGRFDIVGGSKDLAYGQVLDRLGVALGYDFPCGQELDALALSAEGEEQFFSPVKVSDCFVNLSGLESQGQRLLAADSFSEPKRRQRLAAALLDRLAASVCEMCCQLHEKYGVTTFIFAGGVSASEYMKKYLRTRLTGRFALVFGDPALAADNAIGISLLGGSKIWL